MKSTICLLVLGATSAYDWQQQALADAGPDTQAECHNWAAAGECLKNSKYMLAECQTSCIQSLIAGSTESGIYGVTRKPLDHPLDDPARFLIRFTEQQ